MEDKYSITVRAHKKVMPSHDEVQETILNALSALVRDKVSASGDTTPSVSVFRIDVGDDFSTK